MHLPAFERLQVFFGFLYPLAFKQTFQLGEKTAIKRLAFR
jgi:hypothetical protein